MGLPAPEHDPYFSNPGAGEHYVNTDVLAGLYVILTFLLLLLRWQNS
jgi:hypothetical protein